MRRTDAPTLLDRPPPGWFVLDVMRTDWRKSDWVALMIDVDPDDRPHSRPVSEAWLRVPGKHRNRKAAWAALQNMMGTRH
jgi:hypothetical protein